MFRMLRRVALVLVALVALTAGLGIGYFWYIGAEAMGRAEASGWFDPAPSKAPLTPFEAAAVKVFYAPQWNATGFPCREIVNLADSASGNPMRKKGTSISMTLGDRIGLQEFKPDRTLQSHLRRASLICLLEQRYSDTELLRVQLQRANFGDITGVNEASQTLFGKPAGDLDPDKIVRLLALYDAPRKLRDAAALEKRTQYIRELLAR